MISERARNPLSISLIDKSGQRSAFKPLIGMASQGIRAVGSLPAVHLYLRRLIDLIKAG